MPPSIAKIVFTIFIVYLLYKDRRKDIGLTHAIWIPIVWMFIVGSRYLSYWLNLGTPSSLDMFSEGSFIDRLFFSFIIFAGFVVLFRRRLDWTDILKNYPIFLFFLFGAISILWSDFPFVSLKRLIKASANIIIALIILTEPSPYRAIGYVFRKLSFIMIPLSVLFVKYLPQYGRAYHMGEPMATGVALQKNGLGKLCLIFGIYYVWVFLINRKEGKEIISRLNPVVFGTIITMIAWLLYQSNSMTSIVCLTAAIGVMVLASRKSVAKAPGVLFVIAIVGPLAMLFFDYVFGLQSIILQALGRDPTLTTRIPMWQDLLGMVENPIIGFGYESFWLGERQQMIINAWGIARQAHNGYLGIYLELGIIGLGFAILWFCTGFFRIWKFAHINYEAAILRLAFLVAIALHNWTEAGFFGVNTTWMLLFWAIINVNYSVQNRTVNAIPGNSHVMNSVEQQNAN